MTIKELLAAQDELCAVAEELGKLDVDIANAYQDDMGLGRVKKTLILKDGIEAAAELFKIPRLEVRSYPDPDGFDALYFVVGGVCVKEFRKRDNDAQTP